VCVCVSVCLLFTCRPTVTDATRHYVHNDVNMLL